MSFTECDTCRAKAGTPTLCGGCMANRTQIEGLEAELAETKRAKARLEGEYESVYEQYQASECYHEANTAEIEAELASAIENHKAQVAANESLTAAYVEELSNARREDNHTTIPLKLLSTMASLVDGALEPIEISKAVYPAQLEWKQRWINRARKAISDYLILREEI